jgi:YVTN family beta-propeller protein
MLKLAQIKTMLLAITAISSFITTSAALAGFWDSPTNYTPAVSDVYICNSDAGSVSVLNGVTGATLKTILLPSGAKPNGIAFRPDYGSAYVTDSNNGKIYYLKNEKLQKTINTSAVGTAQLAINPNGKFAYIRALISSSPWKTAMLVLDTNPTSLTFNTIIRTIDSMWFDGIAFTPDGTRAYITIDGSYGNVSQIKVINTSSHTITSTIQLPIPTSPLGLAITPDGKRVYVAGWMANNVSVIDSDPVSSTYNTVITTIPVSGEARDIALSPSGNLAYVALDTGGVDVIVTAPSSSQFNQVIKHVPAGPFGGVHSVATSLDGGFTYVTGGESTQITPDVIDSEPFSATFNSVIKTLPVVYGPAGIAVKPH